MTEEPKGIYPILYAYFDANGNLDRTAMQRQVQCCLDAGAHGIAVLGLITEVNELSAAERQTIVEWAVEDIAGRVPLAVTVAGNSSEEQSATARANVEAGADWLILQPPKTSRPGEKELIRFFGATMESVAVPVGIQNFPEVLGIGLSPASVGELWRQQRNFTVMKGEGPVYQIRQYLDAVDGKIAVFNGRGGIELPDNLRAGCAGIIPAPDCADVQIRMYDAFVGGDEAQADKLYTATLPYVTFVMQSVDFALCYGKRETALRMAIDADLAPRNRVVASDEFGLQRLEAHSQMLGPFGQWTSAA